MATPKNAARFRHEVAHRPALVVEEKVADIASIAIAYRVPIEIDEATQHRVAPFTAELTEQQWCQTAADRSGSTCARIFIDVIQGEH
jgi:protein tyrosine phosphatase (PTP) superfamily phosphohydrolase (DUF442 family)